MARTILLLVLGAFCFLFTLNLFLRGRSTEALGGILGLVIFGVIGSGFYFASWQFGLLMFGLSFVFIAVSKPPAGALAHRLLGYRTGSLWRQEATHPSPSAAAQAKISALRAFRWICVPPATVAVHFLFSTIFYNLQHVVGWFDASFILLRVSCAAFFGLAVGAWIAPTHRVAAWLLFALYSLLTVGIVIQLAVTRADGVRWVAGGIEAFGLLFGAWGAAIFWSHRC